MIQGTSSNAGKSVLTAALCRILLQDGIRVAPFKAQNMSLNSFIARDGGEMGRAQVVQAQACRLEPDVRMNPILLKPNSDTGCQVIVRGQPVGNMRVGEYVGYKPQAFAAAKECYDSLAAEFDAIVLEGAGSPGEVNLKSHDIVNMRMAEHADAPVLVVGDIDRGGVFAPVCRHDGSARPVGAQTGRRLDRQSLPRRRRPVGPGAGVHAATHRPARAGRGALFAGDWTAAGRFGRVQERGARPGGGQRRGRGNRRDRSAAHLELHRFRRLPRRKRRAAADHPLGRPS